MSDLNSEMTENFSTSQSDREKEQISSLENKHLPAQYTSRFENLQKISLKKKAVLSFPREKKLLKLAVLSKCQVC